MRKIFYNILLMLATTGLFLGCLEIAIRILKRPYSEPFDNSRVFNKEIETKIAKLASQNADKKENYSLGWDFTDRKVEEDTLHGLFYNSSHQSIRGTKIFPAEPDPGIIRIAAFGDSFIFGQCVSDEKTWASLLEQKYPGKAEVLNFGVSGYGTDQAFIKYKRKGAKYKPNIVIIGIFIDNFFRNVNIFRYMHTGYKADEAIPKPRFVFENGKLRLIDPIPVGRLYNALSDFDNFDLRKYEYFYDKTFLDCYPFTMSKICELIAYRYRCRRKTLEYALSPGTEPFETTLQIVVEFSREAAKNNAKSFVLLIPGGYVPLSSTLFKNFQKAMDEKGIRHLNVTDGFIRHMEKDGKTIQDYVILDCGHYTEEGNQIIAEEIYNYLNKNKNIYLQ